MQAVAAPSRVRILGRLRDRPCSVNELAHAVAMEPSAVSHQLRLLRHLGLVLGERRGRRVVYASTTRTSPTCSIRPSSTSSTSDWPPRADHEAS
jgi:DNA-binding transcriptional ArsR family regulator